MEELGLLPLYPGDLNRGGALFPKRHEPSGNYRSACRTSPRASMYKGNWQVKKYRGEGWRKVFGKTAKCLQIGLKQTGDLHVCQAGNTAGEILHLVGEFFVDAPGR